MNKDPLLSVVVPIYGVEEFIQQCAHSLFKQTLNDIEFIFVNDCTKDNSIDKLREVLNLYPNRISQTTIVNTPHNSGLAAARKLGVSKARGVFIAHCDSDDWVDPKMYETLVNYALSTSSDLVFCDYFICGNKPKVFRKNIDCSNRTTIIKRLLVESSLNPVWSLVAKRDLYSKILYPIAAQSEDRTFTIQLSWFATKIYYLSAPLYFYRITPGSITNSKSKESLLRRFTQANMNTDVIIQFLKNQNILCDFVDEVNVLKYNLNLFLFRNLNDSRFLTLWKNNQTLSCRKLLLAPHIDFKLKIIYLLQSILYK